eukprot:349013_1
MDNESEVNNDNETFQELMLLGVDAETALRTSSKGFNDVNSAVDHLRQQNKLRTSFVGGSTYSTETSTYESTSNSNPWINTTMNSISIYNKYSKQSLNNLYEVVGFDKNDAYTPNNTYYDSKKNVKKHKLNKSYHKKKCSIDSCKSIKNLIDSMIWYQNINKNSNKLLQYSYKYLLDDFHHILHEHLSINHKTIYEIQNEYENIYNEITKYINECDINKCVSYQRYSRDRGLDDEKESFLYNDSQITFFIDTLDSIHCYFIHSYATCMRITLKYHKEFNYDTNDLQTQRIKNMIYRHMKKNKIKNWRNDIQSKFFTRLPSTIKTITTFRSDINISSADVLSHYFGYKFYYHDYFRDINSNDIGPNTGYKIKNWYISNKYTNLKEEIINNRLYCLNINMMNNVTIKATKNCKCKYAKQLYSMDCENSMFFKIKPNTNIKPENLMSIILFCDYYDLSFYFKSTFTKLNHIESHQQIKNRHREFWWFGKILCETVELYGTKISSNKTQIFFHGVSECQFPTFSINCCGPINMTTMIEVSIKSLIEHNNNYNGILLELVTQNEFSYLKSFDCSWLSCYGNENEYILFGAP